MIAQILTLLFGCAAVLLLAVGMTRHQRDLFGRMLSVRKTKAARFGGCLLLVAAFVIAIYYWDWALGIVLWLSLISLAALVGVLLITWASKTPKRQTK